MMEEMLRAEAERYSHYLVGLSSYTDLPYLEDPIQYILNLPSKQLRPIATLLTARVCNNEDDSEVLIVAHCLEMFHNFTLMHDDIMDDSDLRRGKPSTHVKYGIDRSILSGDALLLLCYRQLHRLTQSVQNTVLPYFTELAIAICEGQAMDMQMEYSHTGSKEDYLEMIRLKTAVLFAACFYLGAKLSGKTEKEARELEEYGIQMGIAFQIKDDLLDVFGDMDAVGKMSAGDIIRRKKTLLYHILTQEAGEGESKFVKKYYRSDTKSREEDVLKIKSLMKKNRIDEKGERAMQEYQEKANSILAQSCLSESGKDIISDFSQKLLHRIR